MLSFQFGMNIDAQAMQKIMRKKMSTTLDEAAHAGVQAAKRYAPVQTGTLRDSIYATRSRENECSLKSDAPYAAYVEYGTSRTRAKPFLIFGLKKMAEVFRTVFSSRVTTFQRRGK